MAFVLEELMVQLDKYLENKSRENLLNDLIENDCLKFFVDTEHTREYEYSYGIVVDFKCDGYGFIVSEDNNKYFVFWKNIAMKGFKSLDKNQKVKFKTREGRRGLEAYDVVSLPDDFDLKFNITDDFY